ncbi:hypothetical protein [Luteolibacter soli]
MFDKSARLAARFLLGHIAAASPVFSQENTSMPADLPDFHWHLTARPWQPVTTPDSEWLSSMEKAVRAMAPMQQWDPADPANVMNGAIIDPIDKKEIQYATPLFAFNIAVLYQKGHVIDLLPQAARALDRCTLDISDGPANDWHGEFFCAAMVKALRIFSPLEGKFPDFTPERMKKWRERMSSDRTHFMNMKVKQNWRTFAMKGEWLRQQDGYITDGVKWNEANWTEKSEGGQRDRFRRDPHFFLYHDETANPETFAYNGATTANLLDMLENGYDGASAADMRETIRRNLQASLLMMSGSGEAPGGGRTGEHIWDDTVYANAFELIAQASKREGKEQLAGQFRHASQLLLESHSRFQQESGLFSITKNAFPPAMKNRYATWSGIANYEGFTLTCLGETLLARKSDIPQQPTPSEIGGYVATLDPTFANTFLNAGGMQAQLCTRGETDAYGGVQWHVLGITRFSRTGWDGRLGPGAGHVNPDFSDGVSFAPCFLEDGKWKRVCLEPKRFEGRFEPEFVHPLLTRGTFTIAPVSGQSGPSFAMRLTLTPDGARVETARTSGTNEFGVTWPLFEFDGKTMLDTRITDKSATTSYPPASTMFATTQAEQAAISGGAVVTDRPGLYGTGAVKFPASGGSLEWKGIDGAKGGQTRLGFRYSLGIDPKTSRHGKLTVNGGSPRDVLFPSTGGREFWHQVELPVTLAPGTANTAKLEFTDEGAVIDELRFHLISAPMTEPDQQNFIALDDDHHLDTSEPSVRGGYGDFKPVRVTSLAGKVVDTFVYPRSAGDPDAESVRASFKRDGKDFTSVLGRVKGTLYVGRTSAGGVGNAIDLDGDGTDDASFSESCGFILQLKDGKILRLEADRAVKARIAGKEVALTAYTPVSFE